MAFAVGCGHSASTSTPVTIGKSTSSKPSGAYVQTASTHVLTRAELIAKADEVCKRIANGRNLIKFGKTVSLEVVLPQLVAYQQALFAGLRVLNPPASMSGTWNQIVGYTQVLANSTAELNRDAQTNTGGDANRLFGVFAQAHKQLRAAAARSGFRDCARY
jgi:hypothetical protein